MKLYNTLTKKKEEFIPANKKQVTIYSCGPTVYNHAHIGNLRAFIVSDLLRRWLKYKKYEVRQVMNLTDVDDKTIRDSQKAGMTLKEFTEKYTELFFKDLDLLNIQRVEHYPKATEHINEMVAMIKCLLEKGLAYQADDGIYYSISKFKNYGNLAHINIEQLQAGASGRVKADEYEKENVGDFALWKMWDKDDGNVYWETELGKGRPGWHIECSVMSMKHLSEVFKNSNVDAEKFKTIDIHTGGVDLVFPHHQDEIAQSEGCVNTPFVKYWVHNEHLLVEGKKMSKSLGNFYTLPDMLEKGYNPLAFRYLLMATHYRQKLNFTFEALEGATTAVQRMNDFVLRLQEIKGENNPNVQSIIDEAKEKFETALENDLEVSPALAAIFDFMTEINKLIEEGKIGEQNAQKATEFMKQIDTILGILKEEEKLTPEQQKMVQDRITARENNDWKKSDELRDKLKEQGIIVEDTPHGQRWKRILS